MGCKNLYFHKNAKMILNGWLMYKEHAECLIVTTMVQRVKEKNSKLRKSCQFIKCSKKKRLLLLTTTKEKRRIFSFHSVYFSLLVGFYQMNFLSSFIFPSSIDWFLFVNCCLLICLIKQESFFYKKECFDFFFFLVKIDKKN